MKRVNCFSMLAAALALTLGTTSCIKNEQEVGNEAEGQKTYMTVSISFPKTPQSYATGDQNATADEAAVKTVDVFIYTAAGIFSKQETIPFSRFTQGGGGTTYDEYEYNSSTKIATTTGAKLVYVGLNLPSAITATLINKPVSELRTVAKTFTRTQLNLSTTANGIPMFSTAASAPATFVPDNDPLAVTANNITVEVQRMVAKVTVELSTNPALDVAAIPGTLTDYRFAVNNFNLKLFMEQGAAPDYKDPNWNTGSYVSSDFAQAAAADYVTFGAAVADADVPNLPAKYASENTSDDKTKGELTRVTVRAKFVPNEIFVYKNPANPSEGFEKSTPAAESITTPATFYSVTPSVALGTSFFYTKAIAEAYAIANGGVAGDAVEYIDGYCYWNIFLNKGTGNKGYQWDVLRNDYYRCTITRIAAIGNPTPDITNPTTPPDTETNITTNINVLFWNPVAAYYVLEP